MLFRIFGLLWILIGFMIILNPKFYSPTYHYYFDYTGYNIPFGAVLIVIGALFVWTTFRKKSQK